MVVDGKMRWYFISSKIKASVCLGWISFLTEMNSGVERVVRHECIGHRKQSKIWGWLYLLVVGLPSVIRNRISFYYKKTSDWYYGYGKYAKSFAWPERQADRFGKVVRV
jgi:hypothetical protein